MLCTRKMIYLFALGWLLPWTGGAAPAASPVPSASPTPKWWTKKDDPMVEVTTVCPTIFYELRYATTRNFTGQQIYPTKARCLLRQAVCLRLKQVQEQLQPLGYGLKIWDAYRPAWAHEALWKATPNPEYVAAPSQGGSWHTWGTAVDVTLVDLKGREVPMATDFDDFTAAAKSDYVGSDPTIRTRMVLLRTVMINAGFRGLRDEWWHFIAVDTNQFYPVKMPLEKGGKL